MSVYTDYFRQLSSDIAEFPHAPCIEDSSLSAASEAIRTLLEIWTNEWWIPEPVMKVAQSWEKRKYGYRRGSFTGDGSAPCALRPTSNALRQLRMRNRWLSSHRMRVKQAAAVLGPGVQNWHVICYLDDSSSNSTGDKP